MSGYEVAERLRQVPEFRCARIVAITGYGNEEDGVRSRAAELGEHLVKPVTKEAIEKVNAATKQ